MDNVTPDTRSAIMARVRSKDTTPEMVVRRLLHSLGYRYRLHDKSLPGCPDIIFASRRKLIFVSGCFWHMHRCGRCRIPSSRREYWIAKLTRNRQRDRRTRRRLKTEGWSVLTIWECQTLHHDHLRARLQRFLGGPGTA